MMKRIRLFMMLALVWMTATSFAQGIKGTVIDENGARTVNR